MSALRLVVVGTMGGSPYAGMAWMHGQIVAGLRRLGHEVHYLETTTTWPYDPIRRAVVDDDRHVAPYLARVAEYFGFGDSWALRRSFSDGAWVGPSAGIAEALLAEADATFNVAGATSLRSEGLRVGHLVYLGTDPGRDEVEIAQGTSHGRWLEQEHDAFTTYAENAGHAGCLLPPLPRLAARTRQPVLLDRWLGDVTPRRVLTTVGNWKQEGRDLVLEGETYTWSKHHELLKILELPRRVSTPLEIATPTSKLAPEDRALLEGAGWRLVDAEGFTLEPEPYRDYVQRSFGELTVAKDQNVRLRTGWFSERSACYLAAGRPVVTQDTAFGVTLPTGEGLLAFRDLDGAAAAVEEVCSDWDRHSRAARALAEEHFRAETVLARLLRDLGL